MNPVGTELAGLSQISLVSDQGVNCNDFFFFFKKKKRKPYPMSLVMTLESQLQYIFITRFIYFVFMIGMSGEG